MNRSTLPRRPRAHAPGWAHPYETGPYSPLLYASGGTEEETDEQPDDDGQGDEQPDASTDSGQGDDSDDGDPAGAEQLGEPGKRALDSMKSKWQTERAKRRELEQQLAAKDGADETEQARRQAEASALAKANGRILKAEIRAAAKGRLSDPADAFRFLDLDQFEVGDDGEIDPDEIEEAITGLLKAKPYLGAAPARRFQGTGDGGAARTAPQLKQLTKQDLKTMTPQQILKARDEGRLADLLGSD
ncbi:hypothetical protein [Streptomyces sp. NPDC057854]|uniref:hypothetical protein n=1 Tax=unclassified Streptomyces TaxID=2593676 RepID=UPI0036C68507